MFSVKHHDGPDGLQGDSNRRLSRYIITERNMGEYVNNLIFTPKEFSKNQNYWLMKMKTTIVNIFLELYDS